MTEEWKDIAGYEGLYQVSNFGNVRSLDRIVHPVNKYMVRGKNLTIVSNKRYCFTKLYRNGKGQIKYIHRLVAEHFIPNPDGKPEVNHIDENKVNNRADNLEWCTHTENVNHGTRNQRISQTHRAKRGGRNE